ncbi:hypothetical protein KO506_10945 [Polaribacter vadi]|uniref:hypothetical protein n=1 Tax=Polaribacter TaxID=52959 RepID=UPI001C0874C5|nr:MULTISPECIES: hypothetical protein [Polaribacter]MBU3011921.1 hypothetical protein [Polaribacter vadi]MDO6741736.1 hypothetical protein [Polaribacter sp. 1_MG-2023]
MFSISNSYLKFLLKSTNQHGVHSPFVFDFVTKGLYQKKNKTINFDKYSELKSLSKKQRKILSNILIYFKINKISFDISSFTEKSRNYKILYINNLRLFKNIDFTNLTSKHIILVDGIYQTKKTEQEWQNIIKKNDLTVSINLFYWGLIFIRKEQAKEDFRIRV